MIALGMMDESRHITGGYEIDEFWGADSGSANVHGVLKTLHGCNSVNIWRCELYLWQMIALGMMDESRYITGGYVIDDFWVLTVALPTYMEY